MTKHLQFALGFLALIFLATAYTVLHGWPAESPADQATGGPEDATWTTYSDDAHGYSIEHPDTWTEEADDAQAQMTFAVGDQESDMRLTVRVYENAAVDVVHKDALAAADACTPAQPTQLRDEPAFSYACTSTDKQSTSFEYLVEHGKDVLRLSYERTPQSDTSAEPLLLRTIQSVQLY